MLMIYNTLFLENVVWQLAESVKNAYAIKLVSDNKILTYALESINRFKTEF